MGPMAANCYILLDEASGEAAVIDSGACEQPLIDYLQSDMIKKVRYILLTHGHYDHLMGAAQVKALTGALIYIHGEDAACLTDEHESLADTHLPGQHKRLCLQYPSEIVFSDVAGIKELQFKTSPYFLIN